MADQQAIQATNRKYVSSTFPNTDPYYSTIQAAINSIPLNSSGYADQPWTVFIYPGVYNESITLKSNISVVGDRNQGTIIKGDGTNPTISGPVTDGGSGQCFISNVTVDGNSQSAILFLDSPTQKTNFVTDVELLNSNVTLPATAISIGNNQNLNCFNLHCIIVDDPANYALFTCGIILTGNSNLGIWQSQIVTSGDFTLEHQSSGSAQIYDSIIQSEHGSMHIISGKVDIYNSQTIGGIVATGSGTIVKHVNSRHDGTFSVDTGAYMWVSGMKWGERPGIDVIFQVSGDYSKMFVSNSKAGAFGTLSSNAVVHINSNTATFKAYNSEFIQKGNGAAIMGIPGSVVYLYYCVINVDLQTVTLAETLPCQPTLRCQYTFSTNAE